MTKTEKIEKAIKEGHLIADKIKGAKTISDIDNLSEEIERYTAFVNESFGVPGDLYDEKKCDLSMMLHMAAEEKARQLEYYPEENEAGNKDALDFEAMLDAKSWI